MPRPIQPGSLRARLAPIILEVLRTVAREEERIAFEAHRSGLSFEEQTAAILCEAVVLELEGQGPGVRAGDN